ncbi:Wzz/FepE/Etk N-terminal domain-containing protein [Vibrio alginolyticus]|uniref:Wzz/FepE/Etk N-terminal domain-containing protein n=1 Tax=Vibrio alginolyticus TaxID=663 RepID=UPI00215F9305|nr:Wzz/FepE/Etk N-terminal domain-containing protein [Vibrio alginolyticus]MCS0130068.1 Wzz/FepE/Etk N-terminal domain-containing protein [Vibrio alginolyticus]MCS0157122.1 Wzz/FepE/Etk N-terminal domain-containing protein [Vibrio alginolyticus]HBN6276133.1 LPS O-antigen length regulator [Vibrio parahaemolyticus]HBN6312894.1 LPS O-antigen length regulator [Vibrio parahaemolyticus]
MEPQKEPNPNCLQYLPLSKSMDGEIDLHELSKALWGGKWIIVMTTFIFAVGSVILALSLPNIYKADVLLAPAENAGGGGFPKMAGQIGGLAALAGVNIGAGTELNQADLAMEILKSRKFIDRFVREHRLLVPIMASKGWDPDNNKIVVDGELYDEKEKKWLREPKGLRGAKPTALEVYEFFVNENLRVSKNENTGLYTISVLHYSPFLAKDIVDLLVLDINKVMRERMITETSKNLDYLQEQLNKTSISEMRSTFYALIEEQSKHLMLARAQSEYAFKIIDPSIVPEVKISPKRPLICVLGTIIGFILSTIYILVRKTSVFNKKHNEK